MNGPRAVFIGPMASGKSKIGKRVARLLDAPFVDTDRLITDAHGDIPTIFETQGEAEFRRLEREYVSEALATNGIVSLGGGAILDEATQTDLRTLPVVYLHATPDAIAGRVNTNSRPLLKDGIDAWTAIFEARRPIYESLAKVDFDTSTVNLTDLAQTIAAWIRHQESDS